MTHHAVLTLALAAILASPEVKANEVHLKFEQEISLRGQPVAYDLDVTLSEAGQTRVGLDAQIDLSNVQKQLSSQFDGYLLVEACNISAEIQEIELSVDKELFRFEGVLAADFYRCERDDLQAIDRGDLVLSQTVAATINAGVIVRDNCAVLAFEGFDFDLVGAVELTPEQQKSFDEASTIVATLVEKGIQRFPICPTLPPQLSSLSPRYDSGGTTELSDGGAGVFLRGSIDTSTQSILSVLQVLQKAGVLPPPP